MHHREHRGHSPAVGRGQKDDRTTKDTKSTKGATPVFLRVLRFFVVKYIFVRSTNNYLEKA